MDDGLVRTGAQLVCTSDTGKEAGSGDTDDRSLFIVRVKFRSQYFLNLHPPSQLPAHPRAPSAPAPHGTE